MPPTLHLESAAPLFCGGLTVFNAITSGGVKPTDRVAVVGIGGLGHLALQFLNKWGCEVTAFSSNPEKRDAVLALGAHHVLGTHSSHDLAKRREAFDWILVTSPATLDWQAYIQALAPEGRLHFVGMVSEAVPVPVRLLMAHKAVTASSPGGLATIAKMLEFSARHGIRPLTEELPMSAANEALRRLAAGDVRYRFVLRNDIGEDSN